MKIVWLCHFSNQEMKDYFGNQQIQSFAPWISELISIFKNRNDIELHIVSPNRFTNKDSNFIKDNINYHFYQIKNESNIFTKLITNGYFTNFYFIKRKIEKIVNSIVPDLIHLHGAENPYYSAGILPLIKKYPTLVTIQGFAINENLKGLFFQIRCNIERRILKKVNNFGYRAEFMIDFLKFYNPLAKFYYHLYPINRTVKFFESVIARNPTYDIIFNGRISKNKGIEDLIFASNLLKEAKFEFNICVVGGITPEYKTKINNLISKFGLDSYIVFHPFQSTQEELFDMICKAKLCVLPTYADIIPFTISESIFLKVPVISYNIEGVNDFNKSGNNIILIEKGNVQELANSIKYYLSSAVERDVLSNRAYNSIKSMFNEDVIAADIKNAYKKILNS
jgi:glycosyltransferase involved in cell wall biosynthesis